MCKTHQHTETKSYEKQFTLASFFNAHWDDYLLAPKYPVTLQQRKAVTAIRKCRTNALGKDVYTCMDCGDEIEVFFSCKHRFCPTCSWNDTKIWASNLYHQLLNVPHRHVVMTLPHQLNPLIRKNPKFFYQTLMSESANLLKDYLKKVYKVDIGVVSVLHTFGEQKNLHVHVHMIVSWGGIDKEQNKLKSVPISDRVDYIKLKEAFRQRVMQAIDKAYESKDLLHNFTDKQDYLDFKTTLLEKPWILHLESPMNIPEEVIRYIGRYSKRACLSEYKITDISGDHISFRYKDYKDTDISGKAKEKELRLHYRDFFPLLLQHVPLANFRLVRYYGIYATRTKILEEYKQKSAYTETGLGETFVDNRKICRVCTGTMKHTTVDIKKGSVLWFINYRKTRQIQNEKKAA